MDQFTTDTWKCPNCKADNASEAHTARCTNCSLKVKLMRSAEGMITFIIDHNTKLVYKPNGDPVTM